MTAALALSRAVYFAAAMLMFGAAALRLMMRARLPHIPPLKLARLYGVALPVAALAAGLWFVLAVGQMAGDPAAALDSAVLGEALQTTFGIGFLARMAALLLVALALAGGMRLFALAMCGIALAAPALTGHAAASAPAHFAAIGIAIDALHLLTAGFWIGGLAGLAMLFARGDAGADMLLSLSLFSETAMIAVLLLVMTGMINGALVLLGGPGGSAPLYLAVLGAKLTAVVAMLALAIMNRFRLLPGLTAGGRSRALLKRNIALELGLGLAATALAGLLGQLAPTLG